MRIHHGSKQGAPESPTLWNLVLDEALEGVAKGWQAHRVVNHLALLGDAVLIGESAEDIRIMYRGMLEACQHVRVHVQEGRCHSGACTHRGAVQVGKHKMKPQARIDFLGRTVMRGHSRDGQAQTDRGATQVLDVKPCGDDESPLVADPPQTTEGAGVPGSCLGLYSVAPEAGRDPDRRGGFSSHGENSNEVLGATLG